MKNETKHPQASNRLVPYLWPWKDPNNQNYSTISAWLFSRKFSIFYVLTIWVILLILGFAPRRNCSEGEWSMVFQCNWMMWMIEYKTNFWHFMATGLTTAWFHNDFVHILFVVIFGFMFPVQSFEAQHGTKPTVFIFFFTYVLIGLFNGSLFNFLMNYWPDVHFVSHAFSRAWMGGSVGVFALIGGLSFFSRKKWFLFSLVFAFELLNHYVLGNNIYISFIHITSATFGWLQCWIWMKLTGMGFSLKIVDLKRGNKSQTI